MTKKKNKSNTPRRKKMKQPARLQSAKNWIPKYEGKNIVRGYMNWFVVDELCALKELKILGIDIPDSRITEARAKLERKVKNNREKKEKVRREKLQTIYQDSDEEFSYIAGYTSGGSAYGVTWEESGETPPNWGEIYLKKCLTKRCY